jgi:hypothetical protein
MTSKFVSFLKKAGQVIVAGANIAGQIDPVLLPLLNLAIPASKQAAAQTIETSVESDFSLMSQSVMSAETMGATLTASGTTVTGAQKAQAAATGIMAILQNSEAMVGKTIGNPTAANAAAVAIAGAVADWWNAVDGKSLPTPPATA